MRISDWSSDVCSSDLEARPQTPRRGGRRSFRYISWRRGAGDEVALYPLWPLTIWHLAMLARGIKDGIVKNCAGGDLAGGKAAQDIADLAVRAPMGGTVIATGEQAGHLLHGDARTPGTQFLHDHYT